MVHLDDLRAKFREQLFNNYIGDLRKGVLTVDEAHKLSYQLQKALENAKRTSRRVIIESQNGTWSQAEVEDQLVALKRALSEI